MIEVDTQQTTGQDNHNRRIHIGRAYARLRRDPLLLAILGLALGLAILVLAVAVYWGSGPVLAEAPWYIPLVSAFVALTTLCISYLALGHYHVMRDPLSFWVGSGFAAYGIGQIFYALSWPGLLAGGEPILGHLGNTSAWIALIDLTVLSSFLLTAVLSKWPQTQSLQGWKWLGYVFACLLASIIVFVLLISIENYLPVFISATGRFLAPMPVWVSLLLLSFLLGSFLSLRYYSRTEDKLAAYIAIPQLALIFICTMVLIGGKRYDLWWYLQRVILVTGFLAVLIGLLSQYVNLLRREKEGTRLLEAILDNIPIGLAVTGGPPYFPIARVSRHGLEMNQRPREQLIGSPAGFHQENWKLFMPDGVTLPSAEQMPLYRASRFGEEIRNAELVMQTHDGRMIPTLVNASPIRDAQGNIVAAVNTWLDITDRKRAENILKESEAMYRAMARSIPNGGIFVVDRDLRYRIAEGAVVEKFGYTREMLEGHTVSEIFDEETAAKMEARFHRVFAGETISYETENNGRIYWTQHALLEDLLGHAVVITLDVTDRKQVEKALGESEQRFRAIINQATAGIIRSNMDGRSIFVNQAFCKMLGYLDTELIGETIWDLTHQDDVEDARRRYDNLLERGIPFQSEMRLICKDGSILWVSISAAPILDGAGNPQSAVSVVIDVTERKQAEEDLRQLNLQLEHRVRERTAELQSANGTLLENRKRLELLSQRLVEVQEQERHALARELHDRVGQSLTALNLNLTIIGNQLSNNGSAVIEGRLKDSIKLVTEMISIVRDVMSDLRPIVLDEYGLEAALQSYVEKFEARYGIKIEFVRSEQGIPRLATALEMTVLRIVQEALLNAARHAQASHVALSLHCENDTVLLSIRDNGIGIALTDEDIARKNGHGLMIMRERAEAVGGTLHVQSETEKGTLVEAKLPIQNITVEAGKSKERT